MNDLSTKKEFADAAHELLGNKAFNQAILDLRKRWFDEFLAAQTTETVLERKAMIKALEAIPTELKILINDYKMALNRQHKHG
jgi:t-SNARE complex subunit (syntaxin)